MNHLPMTWILSRFDLLYQGGYKPDEWRTINGSLQYPSAAHTPSPDVFCGGPYLGTETTSLMREFWIPSRELTYPPKNGILKMIFLFPRWDMLVPWRVNVLFFVGDLFKFATSRHGYQKLVHGCRGFFQIPKKLGAFLGGHLYPVSFRLVDT